jgi:hypothetical protein
LEINTKVDIDVAALASPGHLPAAGAPMLSLGVVTRVPGATLSAAGPRSRGVGGRRGRVLGLGWACLWRLVFTRLRWVSHPAGSCRRAAGGTPSMPRLRVNSACNPRVGGVAPPIPCGCQPNAPDVLTLEEPGPAWPLTN